MNTYKKVWNGKEYIEVVENRSLKDVDGTYFEWAMLVVFVIAYATFYILI